MNGSRSKIKGVSFHHRSHKTLKKNKPRLSDFFQLDELYIQVKRETPQPFSKQDIQRFICDHGRNEINSQISRCIDFHSKWQGILKVIERCFPQRCFLNSEHLIENEYTQNHSEMEIYLMVKRCIALWKHHLTILEMSSQAQYYARNYFNKKNISNKSNL